MKPYDDCIYCGGAVSEQSERVDYRFHGQLYLLEGVPTGVCQQCGEKFYTAETAKKMESAIRNCPPTAPIIAVPVIKVA